MTRRNPRPALPPQVRDVRLEAPLKPYRHPREPKPKRTKLPPPNPAKE